MPIVTMSLGEALEKGYDIVGAQQPYREEATLGEQAIIIGAEIVPAIVGGIFLGPKGAIGGGALGNYFSQQYRIERGLQDDLSLGELTAATAASAVPMGKLAGMGAAGRTAARAGQGAGLASAEATARTLLEEGRMPTQEEYASTVLFGGAFGGGIGALEARWLAKTIGGDIKEGATRPEVIDSVAETITEANGIENVKVGNPVIEQIIGNNLDGISTPKVAAEELLKATEAQLLRESEAAVNAAAKAPRSPDTLSLDDTMQILTTPNVANVGGEGGAMMARAGRYDDETGNSLKNLLDRDAAQQDELFGFINDKKTIVKGDMADTTELRRINERLSMIDHKEGKGKGAKKERAKLNAARNRIHNRHGLLDLEATMQGRQVGEARQPTKDMPFKDRPMEGAGMAGKYEAMAKKYWGENYEKMFGGLVATGATGAAVASTMSDEDREGMSRAGLGGTVIAALLLAGLAPKAFKRFRKTPTFNRINEQVKRNPKGTEPDIVQQDKVKAQADKAIFQNPSELTEWWDDAKRIVRNTLEPLSRTLKNINPLINSAFRRHEMQINLRTREYLDRISPFIAAMSTKLKGHEADQRLFKRYLLNGEKDELGVLKVVQLADKYRVDTKGFSDMREALEDLRTYAREEGGIDVGYLEDYFPRNIKNYNAFKAWIDGDKSPSGLKNQVEEALEEYAQKHNLGSVNQIKPGEAAEVTSRVLRGYPIGADSMLPGNLKQRKIREVTDDMLNAYDDPADAIKNYVERVVQSTEVKQFLYRKPDLGGDVEGGFPGSRDSSAGPPPKSDLGSRMEVDDSLAGELAEQLLVENKNYTREDIDKLKDIIQSRFSGKTVGSFIRGVKNANYIAVMGNFGSAITQLGDMAYSIHFNGFNNTFKSLLQKENNFNFVKHFNLNNHNIDTVTNTDGLSKVLDKVFTLTGLKKLDQLGKNTTMNASWKKYRAQAMNDSPGLQDELAPVFGTERAGRMVKSLRDTPPGSKNLPKDVEELIWYKFLDLSPSTLGEMSKYYNESGDLRIMYMLKTFTVKQLDIYREAAGAEIGMANKLYSEGKHAEAAKVGAVGLKKLMGLAAVFAAANASTDVMKDLLYGRPIERDDLLEDNIWKLLGINRYLVRKMNREGPGKAFLEGLLPPTTVFDRTFQDISAIAGDKEYKGNMLQGTPLDMVYWRYLGGQDKIKKMESQD
tara:strand:+ start:1740 stop:5306 length:3567 start_codon:yes stop_codon:yes gene_type:complete